MKTKEVTKKKILNKAYFLFLTRNVEKVTIADIEEAVSFTRGAVYYYYKDKVELFINVVDEYFFSIFDNSNLDLYRNMSLCGFLETYISPTERFANQIITMYPNIDPCVSFYHFIVQCLQYYPNFKLRCKSEQAKEWLLWKDVITRAQKRHELRCDIDYTPYICYLANISINTMFHSIFNLEPCISSKEYLRFILCYNKKTEVIDF